jgi:hypothetical protein
MKYVVGAASTSAVPSCQEAQLLSVFLCQSNEALYLLGFRPELLAEVLDDCGEKRVQRKGLRTRTGKDGGSPLEAGSRRTRFGRFSSCSCGTLVPETAPRKVATRSGIETRSSFSSPYVLCECKEMALPRNWLNGLTPITFLTATTRGAKGPEEPAFPAYTTKWSLPAVRPGQCARIRVWRLATLDQGVGEVANHSTGRLSHRRSQSTIKHRKLGSPGACRCAMLVEGCS